MTTANVGNGQLTPFDLASEFDTLSFLIRQLMARMDTMKLVRVEAVHGGGVGATSPTVDVTPLVSQVDGMGNAVPHGTVYGLQCLRLQAGVCAVVLDPRPGDVGFVVAADRDISAAVASPGKQVTPSSFRKFDISDGVYVGALLGQAPTCYVLLQSDGHVKIADASGNVLQTSASGFALTGNVAVTGNITATGSITAGQGTGDQVGLQTHLHTSGSAGNPTSAPTPGT